MPRDRTYGVAALAVAALALLSAVALPGAIARPSAEEPIRPGPVDVVEAPISVGTVSGQTVELVLHATLQHHGPPTENVSVRVRAFDTDSGLLVAQERVQVGTLRGDGIEQVDAALTVAREGGYRLEAVVFRGDVRVDRFTTEVSGLRALKPPYARTNVSFTDADVLPPITVTVADVSENRTTLTLGTWLTATGPTTGGELTLRLLVRQAESNIVADSATVRAGDIREGRTSVVEAQVTVPADYNYYVDALLLRDGVVVDTVRVAVALDPEETIEANVTERDVEFRVGDFEQSGEATPPPEGTPAPRSAQSPGFGFAVGVIGLLLAALLARRVDR